MKQIIITDWKSHEQLSCKSPNFIQWLRKRDSVSLFLQNKLENEIYYKEVSSSFVSSVLLREAIVYNQNKPLIYAQTKFPKELIHKIPSIANLGDSSLGEFLLNNDQFFKEDMSFGYLKYFEQLPTEIQENQEISKRNTLLCRRSILAICNHKAELVEVFLPEIEKLF